MSDLARQYPNHEIAGRPSPGPLRDWLAAMKAVTAAQQAERTEAVEDVRPGETGARTTEPVRTLETQRPAEAALAWTPRVVSSLPAREPSAEADISELISENMMLKAKLRTETDRYDALQSVLAQELRNLRAHVEEDMRELDEVRAERDRLLDLHETLHAELQAARDELGQEAEILNATRDDRDLWMARAEALAQPLFQKR